MTEIHFTEAQEYLRCQRKWYNSNYLQLEPLELSSAMRFGGCFHQVKEAYLKGNVEPGYTRETLGDSDNRLLFKLFEVWREWYLDQSYQHLQIEEPLSIMLHGAKFIVTPDGILRDDDDELWIDETKTAGQFDEDRLMLDLQGRVQMLVALENGIKVAGVKYTQVRKSNPDTAKVEIIKEFELRFPEGALRDAAVTVDTVVEQIVLYRSSLETGYLDIDRAMLRNSNPISFMDCMCPFEKACTAAWMGREQEALTTLYKAKEPR